MELFTKSIQESLRYNEVSLSKVTTVVLVEIWSSCKDTYKYLVWTFEFSNGWMCFQYLAQWLEKRKKQFSNFFHPKNLFNLIFGKTFTRTLTVATFFVATRIRKLKPWTTCSIKSVFAEVWLVFTMKDLWDRKKYYSVPTKRYLFYLFYCFFCWLWACICLLGNCSGK